MGLAEGACVPLVGFGSTDCVCEFHLFFLDRRPSRERFRQVLGGGVAEPFLDSTVECNLAIYHNRHESVALCVPELHDLITAVSQLSPSSGLRRILLDGFVLVTLNTECGVIQMLSTCAADEYGFTAASTDVPVINCEATDFRSSASSTGKYPGWNSSCGFCGEVVTVRHLAVGATKLRLRKPLAFPLAGSTWMLLPTRPVMQNTH
jgi:hypothetical protein